MKILDETQVKQLIDDLMELAKEDSSIIESKEIRDETIDNLLEINAYRSDKQIKDFDKLFPSREEIS